ncbi:MAG: N-acetyl-gamma-glutamyl-phosphate reductase [Chloroflexi bacterium]|nr:N-acetyl-gamma-glutamyl-phosphate reductase [Chloroflexota bacterium]
MAKTRVGIVNVTGYVGAELARILLRHPAVEIVSATGRSEAGKNVGSVFPHLAPVDLIIQHELGDVDLAFSALPHRASAAAVLPLLKKGVRVIDTSADFRLKDATEYQRWYEHAHPDPEALSAAAYGLPELHRQEIQAARLVANPGCYPTCTILGLAPALKNGLIEGHIVVDSKSGVSGAGRTLKLESHFSEVNENLGAYSLRGHRHLPEILQELNGVSAKRPVSLTFVPHLIPMTRGMLSSCYATLKPGKTETEVKALYADFYRDEPFVKIVDRPPQTKHTLGSNLCLIYPTVDTRTGTLVVLSCLDNLVKGAAGQAVQNMNLMLGIPESTGIDMLPLYP